MSIRVARKRADAYQHGDLRRALIQAGLKLLSEGGVAGLSLRAAAELAGVSHAAPYRHFRDKNALVAAIAEEGFRLLTAEMRAAIVACGSSDLLVRLRAAGSGYVTFALRHPAYFRTIFSEVTYSEKDTEPEMQALRAAGEEAYAVLRDLIGEGIPPWSAPHRRPGPALARRLVTRARAEHADHLGPADRARRRPRRPGQLAASHRRPRPPAGDWHQGVIAGARFTSGSA